MEELQYPLDNIWFSRGFTSSHRGVDIGWFTKYGQNMPMFAPGDGTVVAAVDGCGNTYASGVPTWGNYVKIYHGNDDQGRPVYTLQGHMLKGSICVKAGQTIKRGQQIGKMNNSGYSNGSHDHSEVYVGGSGTAYRKDPVDYLRVYPHQYVDPATETKYGVKRKESDVKIIDLEPVARDESRDQIEITASSVNGRIYAGTDARSYGYLKPGVYNVFRVHGAPELDGYVWHCVCEDINGAGDRVWVAYDERWAVLHLVAFPDADKDAQIAELSEQVAELTTTLAAAKDANAALEAANAEITQKLDAVRAAVA